MAIHKVSELDIDEVIGATYGSRDFDRAIPKHRIPKEEIPAQHAYSLIHDMLMLDGNSRLNLATFVTTWMEPEAKQLLNELSWKNLD